MKFKWWIGGASIILVVGISGYVLILRSTGKPLILRKYEPHIIRGLRKGFELLLPEDYSREPLPPELRGPWPGAAGVIVGPDQSWIAAVHRFWIFGEQSATWTWPINRREDLTSNQMNCPYVFGDRPRTAILDGVTPSLEIVVPPNYLSAPVSTPQTQPVWSWQLTVRPGKWVGPAFDFPSTLEVTAGPPNEMLFAKIHCEATVPDAPIVPLSPDKPLSYVEFYWASSNEEIGIYRTEMVPGTLQVHKVKSGGGVYLTDAEGKLIAFCPAGPVLPDPRSKIICFQKGDKFIWPSGFRESPAERLPWELLPDGTKLKVTAYKVTDYKVVTFKDYLPDPRKFPHFPPF